MFHEEYNQTRAALLLAFALLCVMFAVTNSGCASSTTAGNLAMSDVIVKYDLQGTINGVPFEGIGVIPRASSYVMRIESREDVDLMTVTSCHREIPAESVIQTGWFKPRRGYQYTYEPAPGIEDTASCLLRIGTYNGSVSGLNAHAIIDFVTPEATLSARNICNGASGRTGGVSMCQSKVGLIQRLQFDGPAKALENSKTPNKGYLDEKLCTGRWVDERTWEYEIVAGECVVAFMEKVAPFRLHRHTVVGYTKVPIRQAGR